METALEKLNLVYTTEINTGHTLIKLCSNGMIVVICADHHLYKLNDIYENHEAIKKLAGAQKRLVLTLARKSSITREARKYLSLGLHEYFIKAECFVIRSFAQRLLALLYISFRRPIVKTNYFTNVNKAYQWLQSLK